MTRTVELQDGTEFYLHDNEALSNAIAETRDYFERDILDFIRDKFPIHDCILDIGANIGNHTVYFARYLDVKAIVAIEPVPDNFFLLAKNTRDFGGIYLRQVAVGNSRDPLRITVDHSNMGASYVDPDGELEVPQIRIDDMFVPRVTLMKIDIEWHEPYALEGAKDIINEDRPLILIEDANNQYQNLLPEYYKLIKGWPEHKTYLYGASDA